MKRWIRIGCIGLGVMLAGAAAVSGFLVAKVMPVGTGYVAKYLCSSTFVSGRDPATVFEEDIKPVNPLARLIDFTIDRADRSVTADAFGGFAMTAAYLDGCGCALVVGTTAENIRRLKIGGTNVAAHRPEHREDLAWPAGSMGPVDPAPPGIDGNKLQQALDAAFSEPGPENSRKTRAVVVIYDGQLVAERYAAGFDRDMPLLGWSMAKSVTNAIVGLLVKDGKLDIMALAPVAEWAQPGDPRQAITLDQLLRMSSGLSFEEVYSPLHDATAMLYGSADFAAYAADLPLEVGPDERWQYASGTANIIARIVRQTIETDHPAYYRFLYERLFDKIGMFSAVWEPDASGTFVGSSYVLATPRDWARFGLLYMNDGVWMGERILPEGWVSYTTTPAPKAPMGQYGAHFWLNAGDPANRALRRWPGSPTDAYAAQGFQGQRVIVIPSRKTVLVRFGATSDRKRWDTDRFIRDVLAALPQ